MCIVLWVRYWGGIGRDRNEMCKYKTKKKGNSIDLHWILFACHLSTYTIRRRFFEIGEYFIHLYTQCDCFGSVWFTFCNCKMLFTKYSVDSLSIVSFESVSGTGNWKLRTANWTQYQIKILYSLHNIKSSLNAAHRSRTVFVYPDAFICQEVIFHSTLKTLCLQCVESQSCLTIKIGISSFGTCV